MKIEKVCKNCDTAMEEEISFQKILLQAKTKAKTGRCFEDIKYDTEIEKIRKSLISKLETMIFSTFFTFNSSYLRSDVVFTP